MCPRIKNPTEFTIHFFTHMSCLPAFTIDIRLIWKSEWCGFIEFIAKNEIGKQILLQLKSIQSLLHKYVLIFALFQTFRSFATIRVKKSFDFFVHSLVDCIDILVSIKIIWILLFVGRYMFRYRSKLVVLKKHVIHQKCSL
jgi:hypothetical protein